MKNEKSKNKNEKTTKNPKIVKDKRVEKIARELGKIFLPF